MEKDHLDFQSRRSPVYSKRGMVASSQSLATQAGLEILRRGGNAMDAAVAVAAALNVTEPCSTGCGGDAFCLYYDSGSKTVKGMNGSGRCPKGLSLSVAQQFRDPKNPGALDPGSIHCITVPGAAALWADALAAFGTLPLSAVLEPAIDLAENGFPVAPITANSWKAEEEKLLSASPNGGEMLLDGRAPSANQVMRLPNLARTLRIMSSKGKAGFYEGEVAQAIVDLVQSQGGLMTLEDLREHRTEEVEPISIPFGEYTVYETPPNGQGLTALLALRILEKTDFAALPHNSPEYLHLLIEALRLAFADTRYYVADPAFSPVPVQELLSEEYVAARAKLISPASRNPDIQRGQPCTSSDTVYFAVVDSQGNACSFINSNYTGFGTGAIPKGCGFTLQNRGANFSLVEGHPNVLAPGKRPYHTIIPSMVTRTSSRDLVMPFGVMGAWMQPQGQVQVLLNMLHFKMDPQRALDAWRICLHPGESEGDLYIEEGAPASTVQALARMGHRATLLTGFRRSMFGRGQAIVVTKDRDQMFLTGGSDPRGDGQAAGF